MVDKELIGRVAEPGPSQAYNRASSQLARFSAARRSVEAPPEQAVNRQHGNVDSTALETALGKIRAEVQNVQRTLHFAVDEESGATIVRVIDSQTKEVIRQIPAEEVLSIASRLRAAAGGLLLADTV